MAHLERTGHYLTIKDNQVTVPYQYYSLGRTLSLLKVKIPLIRIRLFILDADQSKDSDPDPSSGYTIGKIILLNFYLQQCQFALFYRVIFVIISADTGQCIKIFNLLFTAMPVCIVLSCHICHNFSGHWTVY